jgi:hypothetical protein
MENEEYVVDPKDDLIMANQQEDELVNLLEEWIYNYVEAMEKSESVTQGGELITTDQVIVAETNNTISELENTLNSDIDKGNKEDVIPTVKKRDKKWGPIIPERKSKRHPAGGGTILEKAQALKKKNNLEVPIGKKHVPIFDNSSLVDIASKIGIDVKSHPDQNSSGAQEILNLEVYRKKTFSDIYKVDSCSHKTETGELPPKAKNSFSSQNRA